MSQRRPRRGIKTTYQSKYPGFCGWDKFLGTVRRIKHEDTRNMFVGIFILGARAMELPTLTRNNVDLDYDDMNIMVRGMLVEKQRDKVYLRDLDDRFILDDKNRRTYKLVSRKEYRTFPIRKDNPVADLFIEHVEKFDDTDVLYPFKFGQISYRINLVDVYLPPGYYRLGWWYYAREYGEWWPHRIRAERACQLRRELKYDQQNLMEFFGWETPDMAILYAKMEPLDLVVSETVERRL